MDCQQLPYRCGRRCPCAKGGAVVIAFQNDERPQLDQQRKWLRSLLRIGDANALAQFDIDFMPLKVLAWIHPNDLELQMQCWRLEVQRRDSMGRGVKR